MWKDIIDLATINWCKMDRELEIKMRVYEQDEELE